MKFFNSMGPNPMIIRMFMAEKGIELDVQEVDLMAGENRQPEHLKRNPSGQMPALQLDDGSYISEVTAIAEYLEEKFPDSKKLFGSTAEERAQTRMWTRKVDLLICEPLANGGRSGIMYDVFKDRMPVDKSLADGLTKWGLHYLSWLDGEMDGKDYLCGDRFSYADIHFYSWLKFITSLGVPIAPELKNVTAWFERIGARPSAAA